MDQLIEYLETVKKINGNHFSFLNINLKSQMMNMYLCISLCLLIYIINLVFYSVIDV